MTLLSAAGGFALGLLFGWIRHLARARYGHLCDLWNVTVLNHRQMRDGGYPIITAHRRRSPYRIRVDTRNDKLVVRDVRPTARMFHTYQISLTLANRTWERVTS